MKNMQCKRWIVWEERRYTVCWDKSIAYLHLQHWYLFKLETYNVFIGWLSTHATANNNIHIERHSTWLKRFTTSRHSYSGSPTSLILCAIPLGFNRSGGRIRSSTGYWLIHLQYLCITSPQYDRFAFPAIDGPCSIEGCFHPLTLALALCRFRPTTLFTSMHTQNMIPLK